MLILNFSSSFLKSKQLIASALIEYKRSDEHLYESINEHILMQPFEFLKVSVPAILYFVQTRLLYVALSNLSAPVFQVTYQSKLLTTALASVIMLHRRYSSKQWICLFLVGFGVAMVMIGEASNQDLLHQEQNFGLGMIAVIICSFSSAFAGVYFEKMLKKNSNDSTISPGAIAKAPSLWMRNIQLAFFSICIALSNILITPEEKEFMHGFSIWVWILVALQAGGGLIVAAVIKYADNVMKGLATGVSVVVCTVWSVTFFSTPVNLEFANGTVIILLSVYFFSNDIPGWKPRAEEIIAPPSSQEMKSSSDIPVWKPRAEGIIAPPSSQEMKSMLPL